MSSRSGLGLTFGGYALIAVLLAVALGQRAAAMWMVAGSILTYISVAFAARGESASEVYVAGRNIPPIVNGAATAADWMSAASYLSIARTVARLGFDGLHYIICWPMGYTLHPSFTALSIC